MKIPCRRRAGLESAFRQNWRAEYEYVLRSLNRRVEAEPARELGFAPVPVIPDNRMAALSDNDLLHIVLGVET